MRITHTDDSLKLTEFAQRNPGWQSYAKDKRTKQAVERAQSLGAIVVSAQTRQFKITPLPPKHRAYREGIVMGWGKQAPWNR